MIDAADKIQARQITAPVDITALANDLGIAVYESDDLPPGVSGMISRAPTLESASGYMISVNASDSFTRQRFTIAHEIAHYLLHREKIGDGLRDDVLYRSDKVTTQEEYAANNKAADLLMPRHLVLKYMREGVNHYSDLASLFAVSVAAMRVRLKYLLSL